MFCVISKFKHEIATNMVFRTFATTIALQIALNLEVSDCQSMKSNSPFRAPGTFCGPKLIEQLHDFCQFFYGPGDVVPMDRKNRKVIADECCVAPCSILYIILNYCKEPKDEAIRNTFGEDEMKIYEVTKRNVANGSLDMLTLNKTLEAVIPQAAEDHENVRKKKHVRKYRTKKKRCKCRRKMKHLAKKIPLKQVPDFLIGFADYHENEPIIIANSL